MKIPCTVGMLTHNSARTLERALASVRDFGEIIICDGGSTDDTLAIARTHGARIITQDTAFVDGEGRITDFAGVRNQTLAAAQEPWFLFLDSDEYLSPALVERLRVCAGTSAGAYFVRRKYVVNGKIIDCATTYPNRSMRFFAKASVHQFRKKIHERIVLKEHVAAGDIAEPILVPLDLSRAESRAKDERYIAIEVARLLESPDPFWKIYSRALWFSVRASLIYGVRLIGIVLFCRGSHMPLEDELSRHWYHYRLLQELWRRRDSASKQQV